MIDAFLGKPVDSLPTPALVVDVEALDHNLNLLAAYFAQRPARLRPHFKSHKCVTLAKRQLAVGSAVGITCAKLAEAEVLVAGGIQDVLIANQVVGPQKAQRLAALNRAAHVRAAVDSRQTQPSWALRPRAAGVRLACWWKLMSACGVAASPRENPRWRWPAGFEKRRDCALTGCRLTKGILSPTRTSKSGAPK